MFRQAMACWACPVLLVSAFLLVAAGPAAAQQTLGDTTSLGQVPEDVAFYSATFNGRKVFDAIMNSNAVQRVLELPATQEALAEMAEELDREGLLELLAQPENQQLVELLKDMGSHEIYMCGDEGLADVLDLYTASSVESVRVNFQLMMEGQYGMGDAVALKAMLEVLDRHRENLNVPNIVIGFKLSDQEQAAQEQLARLEELLLMGIAQLAERDDELPDLEGRLERITVGDDEFLTLRLDGSLVPWNEIDRDLDTIGSSTDDYADLIEALKEKELLISLGVRDGYALLALGPNHDFLTSLGEGPALWDRDELAPLRDAELAREEIFSASYVSDTMAERLDSARRTISTYIDMAEAMAGIGGGATATGFINDVPELRRDLFSLLPDRRSMMSYSFFTDRGVEGYAYDRSLDMPIDSSQTLPILEHGGDPLLMIAGRQPYSTRGYELAVKWAGKFYGYWETEMRAWMAPQEAQMFQEMREAAAPHLEELDKIVETMLLPSMADGQRALVIDGKMTSESWFRYMDPPEQALPMVEVGLVIGLSDADMLVEACTSGREVLNELFEDVADASGGEMTDDMFIPAPETTDLDGATLFSYPWQEMNFHEEIKPNAVVSEDWLILSLSPDHSRRLLEETSLPNTPPLARRDQPLAGAVYINVAGAIDTIEPWVDYFVAGNDTWGQYDYGPVEWEDEWTEEAEMWDEAEGEDPFDEDPFGEEGIEDATEEDLDDLFEEDPFGEEIEEIEDAPEDQAFEEDPFGGEDPFEDREPHEFENEYGIYEEDYYYEPQPSRDWAPGEIEQTSQAILNLIRSVDSFSAAMYQEDDALVTHFEWRIVDAGSETPYAENSSEE